jgi:hypothetical protein
MGHEMFDRRKYYKAYYQKNREKLLARSKRFGNNAHKPIERYHHRLDNISPWEAFLNLTGAVIGQALIDLESSRILERESAEAFLFKENGMDTWLRFLGYEPYVTEYIQNVIKGKRTNPCKLAERFFSLKKTFLKYEDEDNSPQSGRGRNFHRCKREYPY